MSEPPAEVSERLLTAWRGEILAGAVYTLIARRLEAREADILHRMADAESSHRRRLEQRMQELGVSVPDPGTVHVPLWMRMQARIAPIDRLLAAREAAENEEVDDLYKRATGDPDTDRLLREIRKEERSHSLAVAELRSGSDSTDGSSSEPRPPTEPERSPTGHRSRSRGPGRGSTASSDARSGTGPARAGSRARSMAPTTGWQRCSGSSPACPERPAARARC